MIRVRTDGAWVEVSAIKPPSASFPYWTFYPVDKTEEGYSRCFFYHTKEVPNLEIQEDQEEVKPENVRQSQMPSVLGDYRDLTS